MKTSDAVGMLGANLARRKGRTSLTLAGVVVGVAALVLMVSLALALERGILRVFETEDSLRTILAQHSEGGTGGEPGFGDMMGFGLMSPPITDSDIEDIRKLPGVGAVIPELGLALAVEIEGDPGSKKVFVPVGGLPPESVDSIRKYIVAGAIWSEPGERAVLIPSRMLSFRFQKRPEEIVGRRIIFRSPSHRDEPAPPQELLTYRVAGVIDTERLGLMASRFFVPMERALELRELTHGGRLATRKGEYLMAEIKADSVNDVKDLKQRLENSGYRTLSSGDITAMIRTVFFVIEGFMACIGAIGLIVSIFGIANTMATAVIERTREIGIMKAVGARNGDIMRVFLLEAGAIGLIGGLIGLAIGAGGGFLLNFAAHHWLKQIPPEIPLFHVSMWLVIGSLTFSVLVSMVAGFMPALRASRLDPVQALRYE